jgi:hypothetical protein
MSAMSDRLKAARIAQGSRQTLGKAYYATCRPATQCAYCAGRRVPILSRRHLASLADFRPGVILAFLLCGNVAWASL